MITASEYIKSELEAMKNKFHGFNILYAFDQRIKAHIIQVSQIDKFRDSAELLDWEIGLVDRFEEKFGRETLIITEPHSFYDMNDILFKI